MDKTKMILLMTTPTLFVDVHGNLWDSLQMSQITGHIQCVECGKPVTSQRYNRSEVGANVCWECVEVVTAEEVFDALHQYRPIRKLNDLFSDVLRQCEVEYQMHMKEKKHSWKHTHMEYLVKQVHTVHAKFTIANVERDEEVALEELTDLLLVCMMVAQRLFWVQENATIPY